MIATLSRYFYHIDRRNTWCLTILLSYWTDDSGFYEILDFQQEDLPKVIKIFKLLQLDSADKVIQQ